MPTEGRSHLGTHQHRTQSQLNHTHAIVRALHRLVSLSYNTLTAWHARQETMGTEYYLHAQNTDRGLTRNHWVGMIWTKR